MQLELFETADAVKEARSGTFTDNMKLPLHRWFRYSAGFSAEWVESVLIEENRRSDFFVLDPFAGSGTSLLAAEHVGVKSCGFEGHPFVARIADAKLSWHEVDLQEFMNSVKRMVKNAGAKKYSVIDSVPPLLLRCYSEDAIVKLFSLKEEFKINDEDSPVDRLLWLTITSILRECSYAGTAQWQYVLPNKRKSRVADPINAFVSRAKQICLDVEFARKEFMPLARVMQHDARFPSDIQDNSVDLVITSPPYPNNFDYADATRLEMTFWGDIRGWGDLHKKVRSHIIRSCSQHASGDKIDLHDILATKELYPISGEISDVCSKLAEIRLEKGGKKTYHTMVAAYFFDLSMVFQRLRSLCKEGSKMCFVVGDSAPYGVYVPVEKWLGRLAIHAGFRNYTFEKLRDRNTKWKNRKHRVPLQEGRLWIEG